MRKTHRCRAVVHSETPVIHRPTTPQRGLVARPSTGRRGAPVHCPYCRHTDTRVLDSRVADDGGSIRRRRTCSACDAPVHDRRADAADRAQALRRERAVHPRQGDRRRPEGLQGPPGHRGPARLPRPGRSRTRSGSPAPPRSRPTRWAWRSSARCARSTRSPTCGSRASTGPSSPPTTSRTRSPCSALSAQSADHLSPFHGLTTDGPACAVGKLRAPGPPLFGTRRRHRLSVPAAMIEHTNLERRDTRGMTETVSGGAKAAQAGKSAG